MLGVVDLLDHDAVQAPLRGLRGDRSPVVPAGGGHHAGEAFLLGLMGAEGCPASLEAARGIGGLVLDQDSGPLTGGGDGADRLGEPVQLVERGTPDLGVALDPGDILQAVAGGRHHRLIIESDRASDEFVIVQAQGRTHDRILTGHHGRVGIVTHRSVSFPMVSSSPTVSPKLWV